MDGIATLKTLASTPATPSHQQSSTTTSGVRKLLALSSSSSSSSSLATSASTASAAPAGSPNNAVSCLSSSVADRRLVRRELMTWAKKIPLVVGLEVIAESIVGTEMVKSLLEPMNDMWRNSASSVESSLNGIETQDELSSVIGDVCETQSIKDIAETVKPEDIEIDCQGDVDGPLDLSRPGDCSEMTSGLQTSPPIRVPTLRQKKTSTSVGPSANSAGQSLRGAIGTERRTYTEKQMNEATVDVRSGRIGTKRASDLYGVPRSTLRNRVLRIMAAASSTSPTAGRPFHSNQRQQQQKPTSSNSSQNSAVKESGSSSSSNSKLDAAESYRDRSPSPRFRNGTQSSLAADDYSSSNQFVSGFGDLISTKLLSGWLDGSPDKDYPENDFIRFKPATTKSEPVKTEQQLHYSPNSSSSGSADGRMPHRSTDSKSTSLLSPCDERPEAVYPSDGCRSPPQPTDPTRLEQLILKFTEQRAMSELSECRKLCHDNNVGNSLPFLSPFEVRQSAKSPGQQFDKPTGNGNTRPNGGFLPPGSTALSSHLDLVLRNVIMRTLADKFQSSDHAVNTAKTCWPPFGNDQQTGRYMAREVEKVDEATNLYSSARDAGSNGSVESSSSMETEIVGGRPVNFIAARKRRCRRFDHRNARRSRDVIDNHSSSSGDDCGAASGRNVVDSSNAKLSEVGNRFLPVGPETIPMKKTRPKRGQYRKYNRQLLMEAVRAVQQGDMSVHRAGSYYGVPHSTLEYKVKERHLLRQKKTASASNSSTAADESSSAADSGQQHRNQERQPHQQQPVHLKQSQCNVSTSAGGESASGGRKRTANAGNDANRSPHRRFLEGFDCLSESSRSYLRQLQDAANLAAATASSTRAATNAVPGPYWPLQFGDRLSAEDTMALSSVLYPWNYLLPPDAGSNDPMAALYSASAAVLSAAVAAKFPPPPTPSLPLGFPTYSNSLPVGFGWPPPSSQSVSTRHSPARISSDKLNSLGRGGGNCSNGSGFGLFSSPDALPLFDGGNGSMFSMSASDLLKSFQLKVQAKSAAAAASTSRPTQNDVIKSMSGNDRRVSSTVGGNPMTQLDAIESPSFSSVDMTGGSRCSSVCSMDSMTNQVTVN